MPRGPGPIDRVNYLVTSFNNPCEVPWAVYVETILPAALEALIAIVCFDEGDVARFIFRPAGLRSARHGRAGRKGQNGRKAKGIRAKLAVKLPPFATLQNRHITQGVKNLWIIDGIGQRLLWWWLLADISTGFLYNWTSMIYKTEICQMAQSPGTGLRETSTGVGLAIQTWQPIVYETGHYSTAALALGAAAWAGGDAKWDMIASLQIENDGQFDIEIEIRIRIQTTQGEKIALSGKVFVPKGGTTGLVATMAHNGSMTGAVEVELNQGTCIFTGGAIFILAPPPVLPPPTKFTCKSPFFPSP